MGMFEKVVVIDCKNHLMGRLASVIAKELLSGQKIVCVRTEDIAIAGSLHRNKLRQEHWLRKRTNTNPKKGPIHYRTPARMLWRVVRGMIPHKTARGQAALERLTTYEGIPHPFDKMKRKVLPAAIRDLRLRPGRKFTRLGDLAASIGWHHNELLGRLEDKRRVQAEAYYVTKKELSKLKDTALANVAEKLAPINAQLAELGH